MKGWLDSKTKKNKKKTLRETAVKQLKNYRNQKKNMEQKIFFFEP